MLIRTSGARINVRVGQQRRHTRPLFQEMGEGGSHSSTVVDVGRKKRQGKNGGWLVVQIQREMEAGLARSVQYLKVDSCV